MTERAGDRLLTADEAADILRVTKRYVLRLAREGALPRVKPDGRKAVHFLESDLWAYIDSGRQAPVRVGATAARLIDTPTIAAAAPALAAARRRF